MPEKNLEREIISNNPGDSQPQEDRTYPYEIDLEDRPGARTVEEHIDADTEEVWTELS